MMHVTRIAPILLLLSLAGCATQSDLSRIQNDMDEAKTRLFRMEKELGGVRTEAKETIGTTLKEFQSDNTSTRKTLADLQATMDSTKVDVQVLAGKVDDLAIATKKPGEELSFLREELERRLTAIEERLTKAEKGIDEAQQKIKELGEAAKQAQTATPEALYQKGLDTYKGGDVKGARELFAKFLEGNPKHELAANARYWLGETYYSDKKFEQAILEFQEVIKNFPGKEKVPAAMFKQAMAFKEIGDIKSARYVLKKLSDDYPATEEAQRAKEKLKELK